MADKLDKTIRRFAKAVADEKDRGTKPYDTVAEVTRIDGKNAWVHIPGGIGETPVAMTISAGRGDLVQVRVANGQAWITGNASSPPTDDALAKKASSQAIDAFNSAASAVQSANIAKESADSALESATIAKQTTDEIVAYAETADKTVTQILDDGEKAGAAAQQAMEDASTARIGLSQVEQVVNVVTWLAEHAEYAPTQDTQVIDGKYYFEYDSTTQKYAVVIPQEGDNPSEEGWYEVSKIDETISNFIGSHMALVDDGLWIQNGTSRIFLSLSSGMQLWSGSTKIATYGSSAIIGNEDGFHIEASANELGFFRGRVRVAYINENKLYITQSVVLQQMDIGRLTGDVDPITGEVGKGQWSWKVHEINGQNNLYLKWLG